MDCMLATVYKDVKDISVEWETNISKLDTVERELYAMKEKYNSLSEEIIRKTDFKALYGKNNETVRKNHVKKELSDMAGKIQEHKFTVDHLQRRISFLKAMTYVKINNEDII